jgi:hypothetical protein
VELTRLLYGPAEGSTDATASIPLEAKVWRKLKHGQNKSETGDLPVSPSQL